MLFDGEDGPDNYEDDFWINDVYLGDDGKNNDSDNGIAHLAYILPTDDDEYVNDFIGIVSSENEAFFEISHEDNVVESGYSEDGMWSVSNLQEGWYEFEIKENDNEFAYSTGLLNIIYPAEIYGAEFPENYYANGTGYIISANLPGRRGVGDKTRSQGVELDFTYNPLPGLSFIGSYNFISMVRPLSNLIALVVILESSDF